LSSVVAVKRAVARVVRAPRRRLAERKVERGFVSGYLGDSGALESYRRELAESGLIDHLRERAADFRRDLGGPEQSRYTMGTIAYDEGVYLYALMRRLAPRTVVETASATAFRPRSSSRRSSATARGSCTRWTSPRSSARTTRRGRSGRARGRRRYRPDASRAG
jgi:hypothetical protein